jgi:hypothetical protein
MKRLKQINDLVENDFCASMEARTLGGKFTQEEAKQMAKLLAKVYSISHTIHCQSCYDKL